MLWAAVYTAVLLLAAIGAFGMFSAWRLSRSRKGK